MRDHDHHLTDQELLRAIDHELSPRRQAWADAHLDRCTVCQARRAQVDRVVGRFVTACEDESTPEDGRVSSLRERLRAALNETGDTLDGSGRRWLSPGDTLIPRAMTIGAAVATAIVLLFQLVPPLSPSDPRDTRAAIERDALPVASLTPGATWNLSLAELCSAGAREQQKVSAAVRQQVLHDYGMEGMSSDQFELDHLITPELGGAPDPRNLWPQRYTSRVWNAHVKDRLEQLLPRLVCDGQVPLETAQHDIARDWIAAYKKYFNTDGPVRAQADVFIDDDAASRSAQGLTYPLWRATDAPRLQLISFISEP